MFPKGVRLGLIVIAVLVVIGIFVGALWSWFTAQAIPVTDGTIEVVGLSEAVEVLRDEYGVAHIYGENTADLFFAEGYVHAQERFWQMEFQRRTGAGRLSEIFGDSTLEIDRYLRHFGFYSLAQQSYEMMGSDGQLILDAYAAGVNAYIAERGPAKLGLEFALLGVQGVDITIEPWQPADSLVWAEMLIFDQGSLFGEITMLETIDAVGESMTSDLYPPYRDDRPVIIEGSETVADQTAYIGTLAALDPPVRDYLVAVAAQFDSAAMPGGVLKTLGFGQAGASNSSVVAGELTSTGMPILANDTHMSINAPSLWYEVGLHCRVKSDACLYHLRGFSLPGVPGILIGHNDRIAWGLTNAGFDAEDLFIERVNPQNPDQYEVNGEWVDMVLREEVIEVRGQDEPERLTVRSTRHGIVATDALLDENPYEDEPYVLSLAWTALEPVRSFEAVMMVLGAQNWDEFNEALRFFEAGKQNWLYADVDGNIGYVMPGRVPIRAQGDGTLPVPGWNEEYAWTGYIPYEEAPRVFNPEKGYIATGNNPQFRQGEYPYLIGAQQARGQRAERLIEQILGEDDGISPEDVQRFHTDDVSIPALEIVPHLAGLPFNDPDVSAARDRLLAWDGSMASNSSEALLFNLFWVHLLDNTYDDQLPEDLQPHGGHATFDSMALLLRDAGNPWWDDAGTSEMDTPEEILARSFEDAYRDGVEQFGANLDRWQWGEQHTITFVNATLGQSGIGIIEQIFNRGPYPLGGGEAVILRSCWDANNPYKVLCIASIREVLDLGDLGNSVMIHSLGQSGHPMDEHYDDFIEPWSQGEFHPTNWDRARIEDGRHERLVLRPPAG